MVPAASRPSRGHRRRGRGKEKREDAEGKKKAHGDQLGDGPSGRSWTRKRTTTLIKARRQMTREQTLSRGRNQCR